MKKRIFPLLTLFFFLFSASFTTATPYWVKPGSQLVYFANGTTLNAYGGGAYYQRDGCVANVGFQSAYVVFKVVNLSNNWVTVNVTVVFYGDKSLKWPFSEVYAYYPATCAPPFPNPLNTTPYSRNNVSLKWSDYGTKLVLHGTYRIYLPTGIVYSTDGRAYGHTILFDLYPVSNNSYVFLDGKRLSFSEIRILNSTTYVTYYRNFTGPNVLLMSEPTNFTDPSGAIAFLRTLAVFNPGNDITLGFMGVVPDLEASLGISVVTVLDNMAKRQKPKFSGEELQRAVAPGLILYSVSIPKSPNSETQPSVQLAVAPSLPKVWAVSAVVAIVFLISVFALKRG
ncbi:hypothetical protein [Thermococcus sp. 21S9]|uniref:hypothetical protein n=1 Tax=Thermococcus sp. 21S9 TaxID=1638223 RepID=UPI00143C7EF9|nr:hypothetical protein [Thermococcus sp. 21S9]NJE55036.1 hypothetical protein [Thermococcus sp. 21S9]